MKYYVCENRLKIKQNKRSVGVALLGDWYVSWISHERYRTPRSFANGGFRYKCVNTQKLGIIIEYLLLFDSILITLLPLEVFNVFRIFKSEECCFQNSPISCVKLPNFAATHTRQASPLCTDVFGETPDLQRIYLYLAVGSTGSEIRLTTVGQPLLVAVIASRPLILKGSAGKTVSAYIRNFEYTT